LGHAGNEVILCQQLKSEPHKDLPTRNSRHFVIARNERKERRGNPSYLDGRFRVCPFSYWSTVDRHGLRPRDGKL